MKKLIVLILFVLLIIGIIVMFRHRLNKDISQPINFPTPFVTPIPSKAMIKNQVSLSLFVPYWTLPEEKIAANDFDKIIYFGLKPDGQGISMTDQEKEQLEKFIDISPNGQKRLITLRMINTDENIKILNDRDWQQKIFDQTIDTAQEYNFDGIVLDLEISAIPFESLKQKISQFIGSFYGESKKNNLEFALTIYGDEFYRARPFDMKTLAQNADKIMIMAYDMHKAGGNPGPNFPLNGRGKFGYDMASLTDDFLQFVPPEKISVIFGLYGYDWQVDNQGRTIKQAKALTLAQIQQKFIDKCDFADCKFIRDKEAGETKVSYTDQSKINHVVWFEDMESMKMKQEYLKKRGISSFSYWAYSYF